MYAWLDRLNRIVGWLVSGVMGGIAFAFLPLTLPDKAPDFLGKDPSYWSALLDARQGMWWFGLGVAAVCAVLMCLGLAEPLFKRHSRKMEAEAATALVPFAESAAHGKKLRNRAEALAGQPIPDDFWREWVAWYSAIMMSSLSGMLGNSALEGFYSYSGPEESRHREKPSGLMDGLLPEVRDRVGMVLIRAEELGLELIPEPVQFNQVAPVRGVGTCRSSGGGTITAVPPDTREPAAPAMRAGGLVVRPGIEASSS